MKKYLITGILLVLSSCFLQAQPDCPPDMQEKIDAAYQKNREALDSKIHEKTVESKITSSHYVSQLDMSAKGFMTLANASKEYGHKTGGDFDKWKKRNGNKAEHYMFYRVANGIVDLYYEEIDEDVDKQFQQYLPKDVTIFDVNTYNDFFNNEHFNGAAFSQNHWKEGGDVNKRLEDMRKLAVSFAKILGITLDPAKITYRQFEVQNIEGLPPTRTYITTISPRDDGIAGVAKGNDAVTSIEIDAARLKTASISDAIRTIAEEVYHKYQMAVIEGKAKEESGLKKAQWANSFNDKDYGKTASDLQKEIDKLPKNDKKRESLEQQRDAAIHSYFQLAHEKDAKEFAGKMAAMEYFMRNIQKLSKP
jgi:hypothetical protein